MRKAGDRCKWYGWEIERIGSVEDVNLYAAAKAFANQINSGAVNTKHQSEDPVAEHTPF